MTAAQTFDSITLRDIFAEEARIHGLGKGDVTVNRVDGTYHFRDCVPHNDDGPAVDLANGEKHWYRQGLRHRLDGPAVERKKGEVEFWGLGVKMSKKEHDTFRLQQEKAGALEPVTQKRITVMRPFALKRPDITQS